MFERLRTCFRARRTEPQASDECALWVLSSTELLLPYRGLINAIRTRLGVPPEAWDTLYHPLLSRYAALVQRLPASEAHHHAGPGGLLLHGLEVARFTLDLKQGVFLPPGATPESQVQRQDRWIYACLSAALLHDLGKCVTDQVVTCHRPDAPKPTPWSPLSGPMPTGSTYRMAFNRQRQYSDHERIPPLLAHHLLPVDGLAWLALEPEALIRWLATIQGNVDDGGAMGQIVSQADGLSVARNLSGGVSVQMPAARAKPLATRLVTGLRYLLDHNGLSLNRRGAAAFLTEDTLWLVSKTVLDALRAHLLAEGQSSIPSRNDRLMDELQQHGILVPNGEHAIWHCAITIDDWRQELTCLRIDAHRIWADSSRRPDVFDGTVVPQSANTPAARPDVNEEAVSADKATESSDTPPVATPADASTEGSSATVDSSGLPLPTTIPAATTNNDASPEPVADDSMTVESAPATNLESKTKAPDHADDSNQADDMGARFWAWLIQCLRDDTIAINQPNAHVHTVAEGLVLVSPALFKDFDGDRWRNVQRRFQKLDLHRKTPDSKNIWKCQISGPQGQSLLNVMLVPDIGVADIDLPRANSRLALLQST